MIKKLTKVIEECKLEKEQVIEKKDKLRGMFKEIEEKAFAVQENYKNTQKVPLIFYLLSSFIFFLPLLLIFFSSICRRLMIIKML